MEPIAMRKLVLFALIAWLPLTATVIGAYASLQFIRYNWFDEPWSIRTPVYCSPVPQLDGGYSPREKAIAEAAIAADAARRNR